MKKAFTMIVAATSAVIQFEFRSRANLHCVKCVKGGCEGDCVRADTDGLEKWNDSGGLNDLAAYSMN